MQKTLVLFKPDCVRRGLVGECLARFERRGFAIDAIAKHTPSQPTFRTLNDLLIDHYQEHVGKPYFAGLLDMMTSGELVALSLKGEDVVAAARKMAGPYKDPIPGTIRGDFATSPMQNLVHTSEDAEAARRELSIWFPGIYLC